MYVISDIRSSDNESKIVFLVEKLNYYRALGDVWAYLKLCKELNLEVIIRVDQMQLLFDQPNPTDDFGIKFTISGDKDNLDELQRRWNQGILLLPILEKVIYDFDLSIRLYNYVINENILYVGDLAQKSEYDLLDTAHIKNCRQQIQEAKEFLKNLGLKFGMNIPQWPVSYLDYSDEFRKHQISLYGERYEKKLKEKRAKRLNIIENI